MHSIGGLGSPGRAFGVSGRRQVERAEAVGGVLDGSGDSDRGPVGPSPSSTAGVLGGTEAFAPSFLEALRSDCTALSREIKALTSEPACAELNPSSRELPPRQRVVRKHDGEYPDPEGQPGRSPVAPPVVRSADDRRETSRSHRNGATWFVLSLGKRARRRSGRPIRRDRRDQAEAVTRRAASAPSRAW
jgi:hypothetical protein